LKIRRFGEMEKKSMVKIIIKVELLVLLGLVELEHAEV